MQTFRLRSTEVIGNRDPEMPEPDGYRQPAPNDRSLRSPVHGAF